MRRSLYRLFVLIALTSGLVALISGQVEEKIVGGVEANVGEFPPIVLLSIELNTGVFDGCGATIINENYILSAAHCCVFNLTDFEALAGVHNSSQPDENWQRRNISSVTIHPNWTAVSDEIYNTTITINSYDICVLKLSEPFDLSSPRLRQVEFTEDVVPDDSLVTLYGWGRTSYQGTRSEVLLKSNFTTVSYDQCNEAWSGFIVEESMLCVKAPEKSPCHGDSGGPLVWYRDGNPVQVGIVSWGYECGHPDLPGMFGHVTKNLEWILQQIK